MAKPTSKYPEFVTIVRTEEIIEALASYVEDNAFTASY